MVPTKELRSFVGKLSWIAGIIPRVRWTVAALYAVLTKALQDDEMEEQRAKNRPDKRPKIGLVATKRMGTTLPWLRALFEEPDKLLIRSEPFEEKEPVWGVVTDASPKGIGGVLIHKTNFNGQWYIMEAFEAPLMAHQAASLEIEFEQASGQAVLEGLAVLRALQIWAPKIQGGPVLIRSDSSVALAMTKKMASPTQTLNFIAAEIAILLEQAQITRLVPQHVPGRMNVEADWLSRPGERGSMPEGLHNVKIRRTSAWSERNTTLAPPGVKDSPWIQSMPRPVGVFDSL